MMTHLIEATSESLIGADLLAYNTNRGSILKENDISTFLDTQMVDDGPVAGYVYKSMALDDWQSIYFNDHSNLATYIADGSYFTQYDSYVWALPETFLDVTDTYFYIPTDI